MIVLSLGAGVQSSTLLLMSCRGELPKIDHAVFADTGWEPKAVYNNLEWMKGEAAKAGIPVHTVQYRNLRNDLVSFRVSKKSGRGYTYVPLYLRHSDGTTGMSNRTCTSKYKIEPIDKWLRQVRNGRPVDMWMGITWDEWQRVRSSPIQWKRHVYPFIPHFGDNLLPKRWSRSDCMAWLEEKYPGREVPRSSCIGCPYHSDEEWRRIRASPDEWGDALEVDEALRKQKNLSLNGIPYLHRTAVPLCEADLRGDDDGQMNLWSGECEGMCGV